jgi:hypothetical protein
MLDANTGQTLLSFRWRDIVYGTAFSRDGARIIVSSPSNSPRVLDSSRLTQGWDGLARDACVQLLGPAARRFTSDEMADPLLASEWTLDRDVCMSAEVVANVPARPTQ